MSQIDPVAGTTAEAAVGDTGAVAASGSPTDTTAPPDAEALQAEIARLKEIQAKHLQEQSNREAERRELEELRAQTRNRPSEPQPNPQAQQYERLRQDMLRTAEIANDPNDPYAPSARAALYALQMEEQRMLREQREAAERASLAKVPEAHRPAVQAYYETNRDSYALPEHAHKAWLGEQSGANTARTQETEEAERRRAAAPSMPSGMTETAPQPGGIMKMRRADYIARVESQPHLRDLKDANKLILTD